MDSQMISYRVSYPIDFRYLVLSYTGITREPDYRIRVLINSIWTYHMFIYFHENTRMSLVGNPPNTVNFRCFSVELYWLNHWIFYIASFNSMLEHVLNRWFNTTNMYFWPILTIQYFGQNYALTRFNRVTVLQEKG